MASVRSTVEQCATQRVGRALDHVARRPTADHTPAVPEPSGDRIESSGAARGDCYGLIGHFPKAHRRLTLRTRDAGAAMLDQLVRAQNAVLRFSRRRQARNIRDMLEFAAQHAQDPHTKRFALRFALQFRAPEQYRSFLTGVQAQGGSTGIPALRDAAKNGFLSGLVRREAMGLGLTPRQYLALTPVSVMGGVRPALSQTARVFKVATHADWQRGVWFRRRRNLRALEQVRMQQAMERDGAMVIGENGQRFYDAYDSPAAIDAAQARWKQLVDMKMSSLHNDDDEAEQLIFPRTYTAAAERLNYAPISPTADLAESQADDMSARLPALDAATLELLRQRNILQVRAAASTMYGAARGAWQSMNTLLRGEPAQFVYDVCEHAGHETNINDAALSLAVQQRLIKKAQELEQLHTDLRAIREAQALRTTQQMSMVDGEAFYDPFESSERLELGMRHVADIADAAMPPHRLFGRFYWSSCHDDISYLPTNVLGVTRRIFTRYPNQLPQGN